MIPEKVRTVALVIVLLFYGYSLLTLYPNDIKIGDWENVSTYISANEKAGQPIVVFPAYELIALPPYYKGPNKLLPDEKIFSFFPEDTLGSPNRYARQIEFLTSAIPHDAAEIWMLTGNACSRGDACAPLEKFIDANYTVVQEQDFYREKVRLLRKKQ